ncbi:acyltransferase family protein [Streptomyces termitum]|uniref:acyltransferase family protein n=1 Tax=Streptomyces termitum TaxID=67368 RepID=UPI00378FE63C
MAGSGRGNRLYVLDGLRLFAALIVVFYHYVALAKPWGHSTATIFPTAHKFAQFGWLGVEIFFLISGFVICMSVWGRSVGDFAVSRLSRLFPAYWVGILLTALVVKTWPVISSLEGWSSVITNLTMLQGGNNTPPVDQVYWTLFVELKFYLLMAVVVFFGVTYRNCLIFCGVWTAFAALGPVLNTPLITQMAMPVYAPFFIAGIAFYLMRRFRPNAVLWTIVVFQLLLSQRYVEYRMAVSLGKEAAEALPTWPVRLVILLGFAAVAAIALGVFDRIQWKWLTHAGALTYPLYLIHMYIGMTLIHKLRDRVPAPLLVVAVTALMMLAAWLIHRFVERPAGKWIQKALKRGIQDVREGTPLPAARRPAPSAAPARESAAAPERVPAPAAAPPQATAPAERDPDTLAFFPSFDSPRPPFGSSSETGSRTPS